MKTNLQALRKEAGFKSAKAFAEYIEMSINTYTAFEQGRHALSLVQAWQFAEALGEAMGRHVSLDELAGRDWPPTSGSVSVDAMEVAQIYDSANAQGKAAIEAVAMSQSGVERQSPSASGRSA